MENVFQKIREERQAWLDAYKNATPEEQARMLEEKKANREREEQKRQQMIYDDRKKRFMAKADKQIEILNILIRAREIALDSIKTFDGKVLNNRLTKAVEKELKAFNSSLYVSLVISYDHATKNNEGKLTIEVSHYESGLEDSVSLKISLSPLNDGNRVVWSETEDLDYNKEYLSGWIESWKRAKKEYDKTYKEAMKVYAAIEHYGKNANSHLRNFFTGEHLISNGYYL